MEFLAGVGVNVVADGVSSVLSSLCKEDKTTKYKESLDYSVCLARAIALYLSKAPTITNEFVKKWNSDLIVAADEGERALRSSTTNTKKLKRATSKLKNLTSKANTYLMLFKSEKKAAKYAVCAADVSAALGAILRWPVTTGGISKSDKRFIKNMKALRSMGIYPEGTGFLSGGFIYNGDHSINNHMKMKGKCPEYEFDEQTGHGKANMPATSCFPSSSSGGAGNHISPSSDGLPEENNGCARDIF